MNKGSTLLDLLSWLDVEAGRVVTAGDTLNDLAMFETGLRGVMVANAEPALRRHLPRLPSTYLARAQGCAGIVEGLHHFGFNHLAQGGRLAVFLLVNAVGGAESGSSGQGCLGVAPPQFEAHLAVAATPESRQIAGDLHRPASRREQVHGHGQPAVRARWGPRGCRRAPAVHRQDESAQP